VYKATRYRYMQSLRPYHHLTLKQALSECLQFKKTRLTKQKTAGLMLLCCK